MDSLLWPSDGAGRPPALRAGADAATLPRLPRVGAGLERLGDAALALLLAVISARLAFAVELREARGEQLTVELAFNIGIALGLAVMLMAAWALVVAPVLSLVSMRALRRRWVASRRVAVGRLALLAMVSAAIPLVYVGALHVFAPHAPQEFRDLAWVFAALAAVNPIIVFAASVTVARDRVIRIVIMVLALASLIHLANTLFV